MKPQTKPRRESAMPVPFTQQIPGILTETLAFRQALARLAPELARLRERPTPQERAIFTLTPEAEDIAFAEKTARTWREHGRDLIVIGSGGSGLSGKALGRLNQHSRADGARIHVLDTLDRFEFEALLASVDPAECSLFIVSKSGGTAETHAYAEALLAEMRSANALDTLPQRALVMAMEGDNAIRRVAAAHSIPTVPHDPDLGGRFSILSLVGLLPAAFLGLDIRALRTGAMAVLADPQEAARGAALCHAMMQDGKNIQVMMPYTARLEGLSAWWRQVWAESLGKDDKGSTPVVSLGSCDQHSQLQLYLDGPRDKLFTLILPETKGQGPKMGSNAALAELRGHAIGDLSQAMQEATRETLEARGCPVRAFRLKQVDEEALGALIMQLTLEVLLTAHLMGVNPFDQPAVEESKQLARKLLGS